MGMNAEIKAQWLAALRSGEYKQGRARLVTITAGEPDEFCCLGVLCDVAVKAGLDLEVAVEVEMTDDDGNMIGGRRTYDDQGGVLPQRVIEWAGLEFAAPDYADGWKEAQVYVYIDTDRHSLAHLNDTGHSFAEIADKIEAYL